MEKCDYWHADPVYYRTYNSVGSTSKLSYIRHTCWGTKECDECTCGGDPSKCDFYPEKRAKAKAKDKLKGERNMSNKIIAVDFDGTLCENKWPEIGEPNMEMIEYLRTQQSLGAKVILWTCRDGGELADALIWCMEHGLSFDTVNRNLPEIVEKFGRDCRKIFADVYIDDKACDWNTYKEK
jgi:hypothetical protein